MPSRAGRDNGEPRITRILSQEETEITEIPTADYADLNGSVLGARANADPARAACSEGILGVANFKDCFGGRQIQPSKEACSTSFPSLRIIRLNLRYPRFSFAFNSRLFAYFADKLFGYARLESRRRVRFCPMPSSAK